MMGITTIEHAIRLVDTGDANPVEVAGYGREATHKGYLSWSLNTWHWPNAKIFLDTLIRDACPDFQIAELADAKYFWTEYERKYGTRKVDLLVLGKATSDKDFRLPIELKTDSQVSKEQVEAFAHEGLKSDPPVPCLLFLLGAACVMARELPDASNLAVFTAERIVESLSPCLETAPRAVKDWAQALELEVARKALAAEVYCEWRRSLKRKEESQTRWRCGYRSDKFLYSYLYDYLATEFRRRAFDLDWSIYSGGFNAVMNFEKENWNQLRGDDNVRWFFEFNDDVFVLKLENKTRKDLRGLMNELRERIFLFHKSNPHLPVPQKPGRNVYTSEWMELVHWDCLESFVDQDQKPEFDIDGLVRWLNMILESFGQHGLMGQL